MAYGNRELRDETMNKSYFFPVSNAGYAAYNRMVKQLTDQGHAIGDNHTGDLAEVAKFNENTGNLYCEAPDVFQTLFKNPS